VKAMARLLKYLLSIIVVAAAAIAMAALIVVKRPVVTDSLVIISPHPESVKTEFKRAFEEWYAREMGERVRIEWLDTGGGTQDQLRFITTMFEKSPSGIGIDIFWGGGVDPYIELKSRRLLHAYRLPEEMLSRIPPLCAGLPTYDPDFEWYGAALSGFGIMFNKKIMRRMKLPKPTTWTDLCEPSLIGLVGVADPRQSGVAHTLFEIMLQAYGWEKGFDILTRLSGNVKNFAASSSRVPHDVSMGEIVYGLIIDFYAWSQIARDGRDVIGFVMPEGATVINPDAIGILKGAPHLQLAESFVRFVLSEDGQKLWLLPVGSPGGPKEFGLNRISVIPELHEKFSDISTVPFDPSSFRKGIKYDSKKASARWAVLNDLFGALLIDTHSELVKAWRALIAKPSIPQNLLKEFVRPPIGEEEIPRLAARWGDAGFRNEKIAEWIDFARKKYQSVMKKAGR